MNKQTNPNQTKTKITCKKTSNLESKSKLRQCKEQVGECTCAQKHPETCLVSNRWFDIAYKK